MRAVELLQIGLFWKLKAVDNFRLSSDYLQSTSQAAHSPSSRLIIPAQSGGDR